jgi:hypothetical protein
MAAMAFSPQIALWFLVPGLASVIAMKLSSFRAAPIQSDLATFILLSPVPSTVSWRRKVPATRAVIARTLNTAAILSLPFVVSWWLYQTFVPGLRPSVIVQCYLALLPLYCMGQFLSALFQVLYLPTGWLFPAHFRYPFLSRNLTEFWGERWATWVNDWLRQMVFARYRGRPIVGLFTAFLVSALWHEFLINVPLYLFHGVNILGSMLIYFGIQALGILGERRIPRGKRFLRLIYAWTVVLAPAPLVMNEGILRMVGLFVP